VFQFYDVPSTPSSGYFFQICGVAPVVFIHVIWMIWTLSISGFLSGLVMERQWALIHKTIVADFIAKKKSMKLKIFNYSSILLATY
jgi:hypothetical protein